MAGIVLQEPAAKADVKSESESASSLPASLSSFRRLINATALFRGAQSKPSADDERAEATRILAKGLSAGEVPGEDRSYLANLIATRTGMSQDDATRRVAAVVARVKAADVKVRQAADAARKGAAAASLATALAMVIGAFVACAAAALGGHERNQHP